MISRSTKWCLIVYAVWFSSTAYAQTLNSHSFHFTDTLETSMLEDALGKNSELLRSNSRILLKTSYDFTNDIITGTTPSNPSSFPLVNDVQTLTIGASLLVRPRILVGMDMPFHYIRLSTAYVQGQFDPTVIRFGDMNIHAKFRLTSDDSKINFAIEPKFTLPTGANRYLVTDDSYAIGTQILVDTSARQWKFFANAGLEYASNAEFSTIDRKSRFVYGLGVFHPMTARLGVNVEWAQVISLSSPSTGQNPTQAITSLRFDSGFAKFFVGGGIHRLKFSNHNHPFIFYTGVKLPLTKKTNHVEPKTSSVDAFKETKPENIESANASKVISNLKIYFSHNSYYIRMDYGKILDQLSELILKHGSQIEQVVISGYSDPRGEETYNLTLSEKRALAVEKYLVQKGVDPRFILIQAHGEKNVQSIDEKDYPVCRRVDFQLITTPRI